MATIAIGDVHGDFEALDDVLRLVEHEVSGEDTVVFLGDYIDRGRRTKECIERILHFTAATRATVVGLLGNHEQWLLRTLRDPCRHSWLLGMEAFETIESYSLEAARALRAAVDEEGSKLFMDHTPLPYHLFFEAMPPSHLAFLERLRRCWRTEDAICVHGGVDPLGGPPEQQPQDSLVWGTSGFQMAYDGDDVLVYGHWHNTLLGAQGRPEPVVIGRTIGIDTIHHGVLTALRLPTLDVFQSGQSAPWTLDV